VLAPKFFHGFYQRNARARRTFGVILMGAGIAEIDARAVPRPLGDVAVEAGYRGRDGTLKCPEQVTHVFRIELRRQCGRIDEIAEHHRQLTPIGRVLRLRLFRRLDRCFAGKLADRAQQLQPVPERNTQVFEVLIGQLRQNVGVNLAFTKDGFVLTQAQTD